MEDAELMGAFDNLCNNVTFTDDARGAAWRGMFHATKDAAVKVIQGALGVSEAWAQYLADEWGEPLDVPGWYQFDMSKPFKANLKLDKPQKQGRIIFNED